MNVIVSVTSTPTPAIAPYSLYPRNFAKVIAKNAAAKELEVAKASLAAHEQKLRMEQGRLKRIEELIVSSAVQAPSDGTVRYVQKGVIAEGTLVRERQPLLILTRE